MDVNASWIIAFLYCSGIGAKLVKDLIENIKDLFNPIV